MASPQSVDSDKVRGGVQAALVAAWVGVLAFTVSFWIGVVGLLVRVL